MSSSIPKPTALVLGANGRLGAAAVRAFAAAGWAVRAQARRAPAEPLPPDATHVITGGAADTATIRRARFKTF